jgi:hypothetical protein
LTKKLVVKKTSSNKSDLQMSSAVKNSAQLIQLLAGLSNSLKTWKEGSKVFAALAIEGQSIFFFTSEKSLAHA